MTNDWQFPGLTVKRLLMQRLQSAIAQASVPENALKLTKDTCRHQIPLNRAKNSTRVLYVSAIALKLANNWQQPPQAIATQLVESLQMLCSGDFTIEVAPSGVIQFELTDVALAVWLQRIPDLSVGTRQCRVPTRIDRSGALGTRQCRVLSVGTRQCRVPTRIDRSGALGTRQCRVPTEGVLFPIQYSHARCCSLLRMAHRDQMISIVEFDATTTPQIWSLIAPNPIPWLDDEKLRLVHPAEYNLISQLLTVLDCLAPVIEQYNDEKPIDYFKLANSLSAAFQTFYSQCRIWGEVKIETPKLAQARLGLVLATQSLLRFMLEDLLNASAPLEL